MSGYSNAPSSEDKGSAHSGNYVSSDHSNYASRRSFLGLFLLNGSALSNRIGRFFFNMRRRSKPVIPRHTVVSRAMIFVIGTMCSLAYLSLIAMILIEKATDDWMMTASQEVTVQIRPVASSNLDEQITAALHIIRSVPGVISTHVYGDDEMQDLLEPWLGHNFDLELLPLPRLIAVELDSKMQVDLDDMMFKLKQDVPEANLDDHHIWQDQIQLIVNWVQYVVFIVLFLVIGSTISIIIFATRGAMENNSDIIEVLHMVGAEHRFITGQFGQHFMMLGFQGGVLGSMVALVLFQSGRLFTPRFSPLFGEVDLMLEWEVYAVILGMTLIVSILSTLVSHWTVRRYLRCMY